MSLNRLENVANFTEFVKAFSHFGMEMVELAHLTNDRQNVSQLFNDLKAILTKILELNLSNRTSKTKNAERKCPPPEELWNGRQCCC